MSTSVISRPTPQPTQPPTPKPISLPTSAPTRLPGSSSPSTSTSPPEPPPKSPPASPPHELSGSAAGLLQRMSTDDLEAELLTLAGHIAAAECRFLQLLAEFDDRKGWAGDGIRSCAHWLSWRAGMSLRTAAERVRVAHALQQLPRIREAFGAGKVSYSKVRAISRVTGSDAMKERGLRSS